MKMKLAAMLVALGLLSACASGYDKSWGWESLCDKANGEWRDGECHGSFLELIFGEEG